MIWYNSFKCTMQCSNSLMKHFFVSQVKIIEAYDLPLAYCNYVFCQYEFWDQPNVVELSSPGSKNNSVVFSEEQVKDPHPCRS